MGLAGLRELRQAAGQGKAFGCFAARDLGYVEAILAAAQDLGVPAALSLDPSHWATLAPLISACRTAAQHASVPVAVHLNHGTSLGGVLAAIDAGCTSVMYDGSALDLETNIRNTRECVIMAHARGVEIEGEIGPLGSFSPDDAGAFAERTGVDWLAVSVPGDWPFDIRLVKSLAALGPGLVLHGASKLAAEDLSAAIRAGAAKINAHSELDRAMSQGLDEARGGAYRNTEDMLRNAYTHVRKTVAELMRSYALL